MKKKPVAATPAKTKRQVTHKNNKKVTAKPEPAAMTATAMVLEAFESGHKSPKEIQFYILGKYAKVVPTNYIAVIKHNKQLTKKNGDTHAKELAVARYVMGSGGFKSARSYIKSLKDDVDAMLAIKCGGLTETLNIIDRLEKTSKAKP